MSTELPITPLPTTPSISSPQIPRSVWISIILLVLMNLGLMAYLWLGRCNSDDKRPSFSPRGPFEFIAKKTQMDAEQRSGYEKLRDDHQAAIRPLRRKMQDERGRIYEHLSTVSDSTKNVLLNNIASLQRQIDSITVAHFVDVRKLLRPDQQKTFDDILPDAIRMMSPPPSPPPHGEGMREHGGHEDRHPGGRGEPPPPDDEEAPPHRP